jgi:hypothetical protein
MTALSTWPMGRLAARSSTLTKRVKCSKAHITRPPKTKKNPIHSKAW